MTKPNEKLTSSQSSKANVGSISDIRDSEVNIAGRDVHKIEAETYIERATIIQGVETSKPEGTGSKINKPNIVFDDFKLERPFHLIRNGQPREIIERYYIMFRNTKLPGETITDTKPVHTIVSFYDLDCKILKNLSHEEPFWLNISGPPWKRPANYSVIISASSKPEGLCLVVRQQGVSDLYVFCDKSYISNFRTLEPFQSSLRIPLLKFFVKVELNSENLDMEPIWISITNRGEREEPLFEIIEPPCNAAID